MAYFDTPNKLFVQAFVLVENKNKINEKNKIFNHHSFGNCSF